MIFIDTNVFLRHLLNDDPVRSPRAYALIRAIEAGTIDAWTSDLVVAEMVFILSNKRTYNQSRARIAALLVPLLGLANLHLQGKRVYRRVFELYISMSIDYVDCYHIALIEHRGETALYSFDEDFDAVAALSRREPEPQDAQV